MFAGFLALSEVAAYLSAVFTVQFRLGVYTAPVAPKILAAVTAAQAFEDLKRSFAHLPQAAVLSKQLDSRGMLFSQFQQWFVRMG